MAEPTCHTNRRKVTSTHICATKAWVVEHILLDWRSRESLNWIGLGKSPRVSEVVEKIIECTKDPRDFFVMGDCDNQLPNGRCGGHPSETTEGGAK